MAKVKVTTKFKILELIDRFTDTTLANSIGSTIVKEAKRNIAEGQSPVRDHGRFERYKDRTKYPGKIKEARPVNLLLSGEMLENYDYEIQTDGAIKVGIVSGSKDVKDRAGYHNEGTNVMAMRRTVPQQGEEWSIRIMRAIRDIYGKRLEQIVKASNKK